jgi:hypothetical protein
MKEKLRRARVRPPWGNAGMVNCCEAIALKRVLVWVLGICCEAEKTYPAPHIFY